MLQTSASLDNPHLAGYQSVKPILFDVRETDNGNQCGMNQCAVNPLLLFRS
jgi:hypothetical protein